VTASDTQIAAYRPPVQPSYARPEPKRAVAALMRRAEDQRASGELDAATVSLERALRIAPEEPILWHRLAEVRDAQRRPDLVVQLAAKSNALANPEDRQLRRDNWRLIAGARHALGDQDGAREAERRAASYE
jgi:predicted Zn-dependent protease